jgi:hypothetical protein
MTHRCAILDRKQRMKDDRKMTDRYLEEDLHECCAVDCREAGKHLLILKEWTGTRYGGKTETGTQFPVTSAYYCRNHMARKLELLASLYGSNDGYETEKDIPSPQYDGDTPL